MPYIISNGLYTDNDTFDSVDLQARLEGIKAWTTLELDPEVRRQRLHELRALAAAGERPSLLLRHGLSGPSEFLERFLADHGLSLVGKPWTLSTPNSDQATDHARETLPGSEAPSSGLVLAWELEALPQTSGGTPEREQEVVDASPNEQRDTDAPMSGITELEGPVRDEDDISERTFDSEMWSVPGDAVAQPTPLTVAATGDDMPMEDAFTELHQMEIPEVQAISQETQAPLILDSDSE